MAERDSVVAAYVAWAVAKDFDKFPDLATKVLNKLEMREARNLTITLSKMKWAKRRIERS